MKFNESDAELFKDVVFLVEADNNAIFQLWREFSSESGHPRHPDRVVDWKQESLGKSAVIAEMVAFIPGEAIQCKERPVCVSIQYARINGHRVAFYYGCSQLVDHLLIESWIDHFTKDIKCVDSNRHAHCDAANFHNCLIDLRRR